MVECPVVLRDACVFATRTRLSAAHIAASRNCSVEGLVHCRIVTPTLNVRDWGSDLTAETPWLLGLVFGQRCL